MARGRPSSHGAKTYHDHDAHKREVMDPLAGALTFLALMRQQATIDAATGNDPRERWQRAKENDRRQRAERLRRRA